MCASQYFAIGSLQSMVDFRSRSSFLSRTCFLLPATMRDVRDLIAQKVSPAPAAVAKSNGIRWFCFWHSIECIDDNF